MAAVTLINKHAPGFNKDVVLQLAPGEAVALLSVLAHLTGARGLICGIYNSMYDAGVPMLEKRLVTSLSDRVSILAPSMEESVKLLLRGELSRLFVDGIDGSYNANILGGDDAV